MTVEPFPTEAVRDLIGIARAMREARVDRRLDAVIRDLEIALTLAHLPADTLGGRAARARADRAVALLGEVVSVQDGAQGLVEAAVARVVAGR